MKENKTLKRRNKNKLNPIMRQSLGCLAGQADVSIYKIGKYKMRFISKFSNSPSACVGRSIIEIDDTQMRRAEKFIFLYCNERVQFSSIMESVQLAPAGEVKSK